MCASDIGDQWSTAIAAAQGHRRQEPSYTAQLTVVLTRARMISCAIFVSMGLNACRVTLVSIEIQC
jgi:hypothetical protein